VHIENAVKRRENAVKRRENAVKRRENATRGCFYLALKVVLV